MNAIQALKVLEYARYKVEKGIIYIPKGKLIPNRAVNAMTYLERELDFFIEEVEQNENETNRGSDNRQEAESNSKA